jgi:hypothetical protein
MEPKSIRAKTTLIYTTQLIADAFESKQRGEELPDVDAYLLPPALWEQYLADRKPRPVAEPEGAAAAAAASDGGGSDGGGGGGDGFDAPANVGGPARRSKKRGAGPAAAPAAPAAARVPVSWTSFVDVNGANGYSIAKRCDFPRFFALTFAHSLLLTFWLTIDASSTTPPPPTSASAKKKKKTAKVAQAARKFPSQSGGCFCVSRLFPERLLVIAALASDGNGPDNLDDDDDNEEEEEEEEYEVSKILGKRTVKGKVSTHAILRAVSEILH